MKLTEFDYKLNPSLIAKYPLKDRDNARLLVYNKQSGRINHRQFKDMVDYLEPNDLLILNNTKVMPARMYASKSTGGTIELLTVRKIDKNNWDCMVKGKLKLDSKLILEDGTVGTVMQSDGKMKRILFEKDIMCTIEKFGHIPIPPYLRRSDEPGDKIDYQTVYAKNIGAVAAPTAGLHFTDNLIKHIKNKGINVGELTLHVGIGTFIPVAEENIEDHKMHEELFEIDKQLASLYNETKGFGKIVAVGTTVVRALESSLDEKGELQSGSSATNIFIYPGRKVRSIDALITNFHLPKSTLLMLVQAFTEKDIKPIYTIAMREQYRFYSYGDAMMIL